MRPIDRLQEKLGRAGALIILATGVVLFLIPLYIMLAMAFKSQQEIGMTSIWSWPKAPTLENFQEVLMSNSVSFRAFLQNTIVITTIATAGVLFSSAMVAYGFARIEFAAREKLFLILLTTMMLPGIVTMIPSYVMFAKIGWVNSFLPLTIPAWFGGGAFNIFLLRQFFRGIPRELDEAAILDGAGHFTIFSRVIMPLSGPALATVGMFAFIWNWRDFTGPLLYLNEPDKQTLELGLQTYNSLNDQKWHLLMAGSVLVMIPLIILFLVGQKWFVKGIVMTGIK